jgi:hypothetical protein
LFRRVERERDDSSRTAVRVERDEAVTEARTMSSQKWVLRRKGCRVVR